VHPPPLDTGLRRYDGCYTTGWTLPREAVIRGAMDQLAAERDMPVAVSIARACGYSKHLRLDLRT
jgi:hypothetical protein